jgi:CDP-diacylglycerol--serine O-phosphatidyltransferase
VCGVAAIYMIGMGLDSHKDKYFHSAAWAILVAMIFDALDGFVARLTRTASPFGAMMDSLCDLITFGVAPSFLVFALSRGLDSTRDSWMERVILAICILYAMCALIRLARFTVETTPDESAHREFAGLPSPAAAGVVASAVLPSRLHETLGPEFVRVSGVILPGLALAAGLLMVSRVKYDHVVNRVLKGRRPFITLVEITLVGVLVYLFKEFAFFLGFFGYAVSGPVGWLKNRILRKPARKPGSAPLPPDRSESAH